MTGPNGWWGWMSERARLVGDILAASPFADWTRSPMSGDASARRYERLTGPQGASAVLMDAAPDNGDEIRRFIAIARHLDATGLRAPEIYLADPDNGILIIGDLGPLQFAQWLDRHPGDDTMLYAAAVDVLGVVQAHAAPGGLTALDPHTAAEMIAPLFQWYAPAISGTLADEVRTALQEALGLHAPDADRLALRDFHAENLIWRSTKAGTDRVGLLDFQDAVLAPAEYDLVSLLRDARRDVPAALRSAMIDRFASVTGREPDACRAAFACLGVQRNLRILGIFARLSLRDGKARYLGLLPRVFAHVIEDLDHPALRQMRPLILRAVPPPDAAHLKRLGAA